MPRYYSRYRRKVYRKRKRVVKSYRPPWWKRAALAALPFIPYGIVYYTAKLATAAAERRDRRRMERLAAAAAYLRALGGGLPVPPMAHHAAPAA